MYQSSISFMDFKNKFNSEAACRQHLFNLRWGMGFSCPKCGTTKFYSIETRNLYECSACHYQTSVTAGTIFEKTHISLQIWFWSIYLFTKDKRGMSATLLSRELSIGYKSAWFLLHRIRKAMSDREAVYDLSGLVELDDAFIGAPDEGGKRGRGTTKTKVIVGLSIRMGKNNEKYPDYLKMQVVNDLKADTITAFAHKHIQSGSSISSDAAKAYKQLDKEGYFLDAKVFDAKADPEHLLWLHTMIGNAKAFIIGTYHGLDKKHMQSYLDEFCFRFNRRNRLDSMFNRILNACLITQAKTYKELTKHSTELTA